MVRNVFHWIVVGALEEASAGRGSPQKEPTHKPDSGSHADYQQDDRLDILAYCGRAGDPLCRLNYYGYQTESHQPGERGECKVESESAQSKSCPVSRTQ